MFLHQPRQAQAFGFSCPSGGTWYACGNNSRFVGCCREPACSATGCSFGNLEPASFDASKYGEFADAECSDGLFYTCTNSNPPFIGCCKSNPCQPDGCPKADLARAKLSDDPVVASQYGATLSSTPTASATSSAKATSTGSSGSSVPIGAIVGGVVGGIALLAFLAGLFIYIRRLKKKASAHEIPTTQRDKSPPPQGIKAELSSGPSVRIKHGHPPPRYSALSDRPMELEDQSIKARAPSELAGDEMLPPVELEGSIPSTSPKSPRRHSGESKLQGRKKHALGLGIMHSRASSKSSPLSSTFQSENGDEITVSEGTVSAPSTPRTPRSPYPEKGTAVQAAKPSPSHPPPISEEGNGESE
ncbi:uncharacterized protein K452DRAFT_85757 [Aplosporella prunicola CBS 121167]|uniref:Uncharacterized protein n=1 Tax=Aplosporella prunicola CBS 121167 TaxID=1176127 RepID=A0A6A6B634_9PEZI|nr:uncharacterized protein K452DRAFT_85757 [Aplosporella prunicola CBS 121167]KAF2138873.1 hypothetical protein K452DRAFT_85757 [Aplosporella prunicola CBS 121167]